MCRRTAMHLQHADYSFVDWITQCHSAAFVQLRAGWVPSALRWDPAFTSDYPEPRSTGEFRKTSTAATSRLLTIAMRTTIRCVTVLLCSWRCSARVLSLTCQPTKDQRRKHGHGVDGLRKKEHLLECHGLPAPGTARLTGKPQPVTGFEFFARYCRIVRPLPGCCCVYRTT